MKTSINAGAVTLDTTTAGRGDVRTMTLEQYKKHAADPAFTAQLSAPDQAAVQAAIDAAAAAAAPATDAKA